MQPRTWYPALVFALLGGTAGCQGCLAVHDYELVPGSPPATSASSSSSGTGGTGAVPDACVTGEASGRIVVSAIVPGGLGGAGGAIGEACDLPPPPEGSIEVLALDPDSGSCTARVSLTPTGTATVESAPRVAHALDDSAYVTASFRGGGLQLPPLCEDGSAMLVELPPDATDGLLMSRLRVAETSFCTLWAHTAFTEDAGGAGTLRVRGVRSDPQGRVAVVGTLGGALTSFEGGPSDPVQGEAFFARYFPGGALGSLATLEGDGTSGPSVAMNAAARDGVFAVTGGTRFDQPTCDDCPGTSHVVGAAQACGGGTGGAGGAGGTGGGGGGTGVGGSGGGRAGDSVNAMLWAPPEVTGEPCGALTTFGSDLRGIDDTQIGFDLSPSGPAGSCATFWTGMAGRDPWPFDLNAPETQLYDSGGANRDGFLALLQGGEAFGCGPSTLSWSMRLVPSDGPSTVWGERIQADHCDPGATAAVTVRGAGGSLRAYRCTPSEGCAQRATTAELASAQAQLVVLGLEDGGTIGWHGIFGSIVTDADAGAGDFTGRAHHDLTNDIRDNAYAIFETSGPLRVSNVEPFACTDLVPDAPAGVWIVSMKRAGPIEKAQCAWAVRLGP